MAKLCFPPVDKYENVIPDKKTIPITTFKIPNIEEEKSVLKTIRLKLTTLKKIEELSVKTNISMNRLFNECIEFALDNLVFNEDNKDS